MMYLQLAVQAQVHPSKQNDIAINPLTGYLIISLPLIVLLVITAYRKCQAQILRRRITRLEKLWLLNIPEKTS
ncbi:hypothetical protein [Fischerella thermalis]|uniref:hypothetical protein n=1 Tax=Fischerella thermalis TaxID=372787 RepID=UPI0011AF6120|nr:hypothetical protein [Fischerella thermalis]MBF1990111.1 hypothetical protein [Fischerella thermalis M58_A2018_009]MBF2062551.1 hypothetical protein [Fischerella thermalis M66_A2018_004]MBF2068657.1 hypothetical protein [Fischerella thermalis M48_A2018_028]